MLGVIGYGKMGSAIVKNAAKHYKKIFIRDLKKIKKLPKKAKQVNLYTLLKNSQTILLAVKPQDMKDLLFDIDEILGYSERKKKLFITVAAALKLNFYENILGKGVAIIRVMPNLCIRSGYSAGAYVINKNVRKKHLIEIKKMFGDFLIKLKNEELIDVVTAISASGPAFIAKMMECFEKFALTHGINKEKATKLVVDSFLSTALLFKKENISFEEFIAEVASPKGTTQNGLNVWKQEKISSKIQKVLKATLTRAKELSQTLK